MSIKDYKTRVTFVTEKETHEKLQELAEYWKRRGRKMTVSSLIDDIVTNHVATHKLFIEATPAAPNG